jgi:RNA polymerase sigma factor (TIGR02999 family)
MIPHDFTTGLGNAIDMTSSSPERITQLLIDWANGDEAALAKLTPLVYQELRRQARKCLRSEHAATLQTTELVHEAYLRLANYKNIQWHERAQFFAIAAQVMRHILVDHARSRGRAKRGGNAQRVSLEDGTLTLGPGSSNSPDGFLDMLALDEALTRLEAAYPRQSRAFEMRFFAGMQNKEIAQVLSISPNQVIRDWNFAVAFLRRELEV